mgnify:CR=1 FL=1
MGKEENKCVIDSRLAFHWISDSFKVFLSLDPDTAAERIFSHIAEEGRVSQTASSVEEARKNIEIRAASEKKRYANLYGIDPTDPVHFDLVVDTKTNNLDRVVEVVLKNYKKWVGS